jgi:hypothetical protein
MVTESPGMGPGGMIPGPRPSKRSAFLDDETDGTPALAEAGDIPTLTVEAPVIDEATAAAVEETRQEFFRVRDAGAANRIKQGHLLLEAQEQLAQYGTGIFTAMLLAARPDGFGFKSPTSAYDLMAEATGKPKRSHKRKNTGGDPTPGRSNAEPTFLPFNPDGASSPSEPVSIPDELPTSLDTSHTHTYVPFRFKGVYVPKADVEEFTAWLKTFSNSAFSDQFLAWYRTSNPNEQKEKSNETNISIQ